MNSTGLQVGHINAGLNESFTERAEDLNPIGPFLVENDANVCWGSDDPNVCYLAYCGEYDVAAYAPGWTSYEIAPNGYVDARVTYLTWKYGIKFFKDNRESGAALATVVAVQALVWAWHSDPVHGTAVFSGVAAPYNDPLNWDGLTPSAHDDPSPRVGFWGPDPIDLIEEASGFYPGTDTDALEDSTHVLCTGALYTWASQRQGNEFLWHELYSCADVVADQNHCQCRKTPRRET